MIALMKRTRENKRTILVKKKGLDMNIHETERKAMTMSRDRR
jgi:hypothetical protein